MEKKRVYQVAKEFHVSSEALVSMLREKKYEVKSHMSVVDSAMFESIRVQFEKQHAEAIKSIQKKNKITDAITDVEEEKKTPVKRRRRKKRSQRYESEQKGKKKQRGPEKKSRVKDRKQKQKEHLTAVQDSFKKTMASISSDSKSKTKKSRSKQSDKATAVDMRHVIKVSEFVSVSELGKLMDIPIKTLIAKCLNMGLLVSINQRLDMDTIILLADEFGYEVEQLGEYAEDILKARNEEFPDKPEMIIRPPVVTVMGHVDHGKTTLLDYIRRSNIVSKESGGITQHIGAYSVTLRDGHKITFIDTPGHEAFTAMRARGAKATDIVILVIAADDSVMPQTVEAINHAKAAGVPIIIAINKIDLPNADVERIKGDLTRYKILVEDWGGTYQCQEISAKRGDNVNKLLDKVLLEAEMLELSSNISKRATGVVIDSQLDKGWGAVTTILIQSGTLHVGDSFITGMITGKIRAMFNDLRDHIQTAGPSDPVLIFGMNGVPKAGETFYCIDSEVEAREIAHQRRIMKREQDFRQTRHITLSDIYNKIKEGSIKELKLIIKADVDGSVEALSDSLSNIAHDEVHVNVIHQGVGGINENDVLLAVASGAVVIGFHVRPTHAAKAIAERENVEIKIYEVIYEAIEDVEKALRGMLTPRMTEVTVGTAEVRDVFKIPKVGNIAGCYVTNGYIKRNVKIKLFRDNVQIYDGTITSLKRFKEDITEVTQDYECGLGIEKYDDIKVGDIIEAVEFKKVNRT